MSKNMFNLDFVNKGKPFEMPRWTTEKHEKILDAMIEYDEKLKSEEITRKEYDKIYRNKMILESLHEIDKSVKESDINNLHPEDLVELGNAVYLSGRKGIKVKDEDFQEEEITKTN